MSGVGCTALADQLRAVA
jgi:hypothetical protein